MRQYLISLFFSAFLIGISNAQDDAVILPGFVPLEKLPLFKEIETSMEVQIGESMIELVAINAEKENPDFARVLRKLKQIRSYTFDLSEIPRNQIDRYLVQINTKLLDEQWEIVYRMREPETTANIYLKTAGGEVAGMTIYSVDQSDQVIVVNIAGNISLEDISQLAERFGLPDIRP